MSSSTVGTLGGGLQEPLVCVSSAGTYRPIGSFTGSNRVPRTRYLEGPHKTPGINFALGPTTKLAMPPRGLGDTDPVSAAVLVETRLWVQFLNEF